MIYEVFISYSHDDTVLCDRFAALIKNEFDYNAFRDVDDLNAGLLWREQIRKALEQPGLQPYVLLLCTRAADQRPDQIVIELQYARECGLTIIPIEFEPGVAERLLAKAGFENPDRIQRISATSPYVGPAITPALEDALRRAIIAHVAIALDALRAKSASWADLQKAETSFWEDHWEGFFNFSAPHGRPNSVALTGPGGSGKSFLIAHCVRRFLKRADVFPILVTQEMLRTAATEMPRLFGARHSESLQSQIEALGATPRPEQLGRKPLRVFFIVDGLDQMIVPGDAHQRQLTTGLNLLVNAGQVLIGCRPEVWEMYARHVSVTTVPVPELDEQRVNALLIAKGLPTEPSNPLLKLPLFLDLALSRAKFDRTIPRTVTDFLRRIWRDAAEPAGGPQSVDEGRDWVLRAIASRQLETLRYNVLLDELRNARGYLEQFETSGLRALKVSRILVERPAEGGGSTVRLRHDLLDNFGMLQVFLGLPNRPRQLRDLFQRCDKDCGWSLLALLIQHAEDHGDEALMREVFEEMLFILDRKRFSAAMMGCSWAVTHALRASFRLLFKLIVAALDGEPVASLSWDNPDDAILKRSALGPPARLTQEAASTLASAFMSLDTGTVEEAELAVPVLTAGLAKWKLRARFIEALGKFRTPDALRAIAGFAEARLAHRDDSAVLLYVARALKKFDDRPEAIGLLRSLMTCDISLDRGMTNGSGENSRLHRIAASVYDGMRPGEIIVPMADEHELLLGLAIGGQGAGGYSDWREVESYAMDISRRCMAGEVFNDSVQRALILALEHDQLYARRAVAQALGFFIVPAARDALLAELLTPALPMEVRGACLDAMRQQVRDCPNAAVRLEIRALASAKAGEAGRSGAIAVQQGLLELAQYAKDVERTLRDSLLTDAVDLALTSTRRAASAAALNDVLSALSDPKERQVLRFFMLRAAAAAKHNGDQDIASALAGGAMRCQQLREDDWLASPGALEILPPLSGGLPCRLSQADDAIDPAIQRQLPELDAAETGPNLERKYRFTHLSLADGVIDVHLVPSTWQQGRSFHAALLKDPSMFLKEYGNWFAPLPLGELRLPGLAVVHAVVLTSDQQILLAQRGAKVAYAPLHWSASFEEQVTDVDVAAGDSVFQAAARRGMMEEFGIDVDPAQVKLLSALLQLDNLNLGAVVLLETAETLAQIEQIWVGPPRPSHAWEAGAIAGDSAEPTHLSALSDSGACWLGPFHPTSPLRLSMLARYLRQRG